MFRVFGFWGYLCFEDWFADLFGLDFMSVFGINWCTCVSTFACSLFGGLPLWVRG